jgi:hypothetical protein
MNRTIKRSFVGVVVLTGFAFACQRTVNPTWKTATPAQIDAVISPTLLIPVKDDPVQRARFKRLLEAIHNVQGKVPDTASGEAVSPAFGLDFIVRNRQALRKVLEVLDEGPMQSEDPKALMADFESLALTKQFVKQIAGTSRGLCAAGKGDEATHLLLLGIRFHERGLEASRSLAGYLVVLAERTIMEDAISDAVESHTLSQASLRQLLTALRRPPSDLAALQRSVREEFVLRTYPLLIDPVNGLADSLPAPADKVRSPDRPPGNYDALETARRASDLTMQRLKNLSKPVSEVDRSQEDALNRDITALPKDPSDRNDAPTDAAKKEYELQMARHPNSFGLTLLQLTTLDSLDLTRIRAKAESTANLLRAQVALAVYRTRFGRLPRTLAEIVGPEYLPDVPVDGYNLKPLRYDPSRSFVWSVGDDLHDGGGKAKKYRSPTEPDIVYWIP